MLKTINPETIYDWTTGETTFFYKALSGPQSVFTVDSLFATLINKCVTKVTNIEIDGVECAEWKNDGKLSDRLPFAIANLLASEIFAVSKLSDAEAKNSQSPSGSDSSDNPGGVAVTVVTSNASKKSTKPKS